MSDTPLGSAAAFARYEAIRPRLPQAAFAGTPRFAASLSDVADLWQGFVLDAYGVLTVGAEALPGAVARMAELRARGKALCVLTNAASYPKAEALRKYRQMGYDFGPDEVVSSRDVMAANLPSILPDAHWGAICQPQDDFHDIPARLSDLNDLNDWSAIDGFILLSNMGWTPEVARKLDQAMAQSPRPLVVANPDLVAPQPAPAPMSIEPGYFAHALLDRHPTVPVHWFGKPYGAGFEMAIARTGLAPHQLAMVGDTLHTDILGGKAAGMGTVLVADHGLFKGHDVAPFIAASGILPDVVVKTT